MHIFWPNVVSNEDLHEKARTEPTSITIKRRRLKWLGHVLRMPRVALFWTVQGKRKAGRTKITWGRTFEKKLAYIKLMASSRRCRQGQNRMADKCGRLILQKERKLKEEMVG
jgi:hypothetical protein